VDGYSVKAMVTHSLFGVTWFLSNPSGLLKVLMTGMMMAMMILFLKLN
jgi:hypothetical protein